MISAKDIIKDLEMGLKELDKNPKTQNIGIVEQNTDGVITASGLSQAFMGEKVVFSSGTEGVILNLNDDSVSIILLGSGEKIKEGDRVKRSEELLSINASEDLKGRFKNLWGQPLDGKPKIKKGE